MIKFMSSNDKFDWKKARVDTEKLPGTCCSAPGRGDVFTQWNGPKNGAKQIGLKDIL